MSIKGEQLDQGVGLNDSEIVYVETKASGSRQAMETFNNRPVKGYRNLTLDDDGLEYVENPGAHKVSLIKMILECFRDRTGNVLHLALEKEGLEWVERVTTKPGGAELEKPGITSVKGIENKGKNTGHSAGSTDDSVPEGSHVLATCECRHFTFRIVLTIE